MLHCFNQTFILFTYGEMGATEGFMKAQIEQLKEENKVIKEEKEMLIRQNTLLQESNKKLKETIKDHQLYEEKLEHRIIELEELLHGE